MKKDIINIQLSYRPPISYSKREHKSDLTLLDDKAECICKINTLLLVIAQATSRALYLSMMSIAQYLIWYTHLLPIRL
jgi:hypothetical protein